MDDGRSAPSLKLPCKIPFIARSGGGKTTEICECIRGFVSNSEAAAASFSVEFARTVQVEYYESDEELHCHISSGGISNLSWRLLPSDVALDKPYLSPWLINVSVILYTFDMALGEKFSKSIVHQVLR